MEPSLRFRTEWDGIPDELSRISEENFLDVWGSIRRDLLGPPDPGETEPVA